jgi:hypothetical protein
VIIASAGNYSGNGFGNFGTISNCPSTSGGIDGTGGVYFAVLLCGGSDLTSCNITFTGAGWAMDVTSSNWAVEGWQVHGNSGTGAMVADGSAATVHDIAFINNVIFNVGIGLGGLDNGMSHDVPGATGFDYTYYIANITQNSEQNTVCTAATVMAGPASIDSNVGTHFMMYGGFSYNQPNNGCASDIENFMFDTWDAHGVVNQSVMLNNISWSAYRFGIQIFMQNFNNVGALHDFVENNTSFNANTSNVGGQGDINIQMDNPGAPTFLVINNIADAAQSNTCGLLLGGMSGPSSLANITIGTTGNENILNAPMSGNDECLFNGASAGTNFTGSPGFTNTTDLLANQSGAPNCAGFIVVTGCMGWNANTSTLTTPSVISDLTPSCTHCAGKGYQLPSVTCVSSGAIFNLYPSRLKGIVPLWYDGTNLFERVDLVTKPCNL